MGRSHVAPRPIERKVTAATVGAYLLAVAGLGIVNAITDDASLLGPLPDWLEPFIVALVPSFGAFMAGFKAQHTPRPDLPTAMTEPPTEVG